MISSVSRFLSGVMSFFALLKNGIRGVYHCVSAKWLQGYLNEFTWRWNHRNSGRAMFETLLLRSAENLEKSLESR